MDRRIGRYEVLAELGRGGFGHIYRCLDPTVGRSVAIKVLAAEGDEGLLTRFRGEATASGRLRHRNIVTIFDFGEQNGVPFIVMELLEGQDLQRVVESRKPLLLLDKVQIMAEVAAGLRHAHALGIIHRDVKPANVMLLLDGSVKIMDFGISLITQSTESRLTPRGAMIGTFRYMAPEQFRAAEPDVRSDIFAYGLIFYELLSGVHPFHAVDAAAQMYNILSVEPVPIGEVCPNCPAELQAVVARLLQKDPELRYQVLDDVLFDLEPVLLKLRQDRAAELLKEARSFRADNLLEVAQDLIRQVLELAPAYPEAREFREQLQTELRRQTLRPKVDDLLRKGKEELATGNAAEALQRFESAIRLDPWSTEIRALIDQAKSAADNLRKAAGFAIDAENKLRGGDPSGAFRLARQALELVPGEPKAKAILSESEAALDEAKRKAQLADDLARARRLIEIKSWKEASALLAKLNEEFSTVAEVGNLSERLRAGLAKEEQERLLASGLSTSRRQIEQGDLAEALASLEQLTSSHPESGEAESMLQFVRGELETRFHQEFVKQTIEKAHAAAAQRKFIDAVKVLDAAVSRYPADRELQQERQAMVAEQLAAARQSALEQTLGEAAALRSRGLFYDALQKLNVFLGTHGDEPAVSELVEAIQKDQEAAQRAAELHEFIRRTKDLLAEGRLDEAKTLLQAPLPSIKDHPEVTQLRGVAELELKRQADRDAAREKALAKARSLRESGSFAEALSVIDRYQGQYGIDPHSDEARRDVARAQEQIKQAADELIARAAGFLNSDPRQAVALLGSAPAHLRELPEIQASQRAAAKALDEKRSRDAAAQLIARARELSGGGHFEEALSVLEEGIRQHPDHPQLLTARDEIAAALERDRREKLRREAAEQARALIAAQDDAGADRVLAAALAKDPAATELLDLRAQIEKRRAAKLEEQDLQDQLARAKALIATKPEEALQSLEALRRKKPDHAGVASALVEARDAVARKRQRDLLLQVERLSQQQQFEAALALLNRTEPDAAGEIPAARERVKARQEEFLEAQARDAVQSADAALGRDPKEALKRLQSLPPSLGSRPEIRQAVQRCETAIVEADRKGALSEVETLYSSGKLSKARQTHRRVVERLGPDAASDELLARIDAAEVVEKATSGERTPASARQKYLWAAGLGAVLMLAGGIWIISHRKTPTSVELVPVAIHTDPEGASIQVGDRSCISPNCSLGLPPGHYRVLAQLPGYQQAEESLTVEAGKISGALNLTLQPVARPNVATGHPTGTLVVQAGTPNALVLMDNAPLGRTDSNGKFTSTVEAAAHSIGVEKAGYDKPPEQQVTIAESKPHSVTFKLTPQNAKLELRGAPAGVELSANGTPIGRTDGSGVFSAGIRPGAQNLRIVDGSRTREIARTFEPGQTVSVEWASVAPARVPTPAPKADVAGQDWDAARAATDPAQVQAFLDKYPNGPHTSEAQSRLETLTWSRLNPNDAQALRVYVGRFPSGLHLRDAQSRLAELAWAGLDKKDIQALRSFQQQNPDSSHSQEAQSLIDQMQRQIAEAARPPQEFKKQDVPSDDRGKTIRPGQQTQAINTAIRMAISQFNAAFDTSQPNELKLIWPNASKDYTDAMTMKNVRLVMRLEPTGEPVVVGDTASVMCNVVSTTLLRGKITRNQKAVKATLRNAGDHWLFINPFESPN